MLAAIEFKQSRNPVATFMQSCDVSWWVEQGRTSAMTNSNEQDE